MADSDVRIRFGAEVGDLTSGLSQLKATLSDLDAQLKVLGSSAAGAGTRLDGMTPQATGMAKAAIGASNAVTSLSASHRGMVPVIDQSTGVITSWKAQIADAGQHAEKFQLNTSGARRELIVLAHEMSQGNYSRFGGSLMVLAERAGGVTAGMMGAAGAVAALGFALYEVVAHAIEANHQLDAIRGTMAALGNGANYSRDGIKAQVAELKEGYHIGASAARDLIGVIESIPAIAEPAKQQLTELGLAMAQGMGLNDDQTKAFMTEMAKAVTQGGGAVRAWGDAYNLFDAKQKVALANAAEFNDKIKAGDVAIQGLTVRTGDFGAAQKKYFGNTYGSPDYDPSLKAPKANDHFGAAPSADDNQQYEANRRLIAETERSNEAMRGLQDKSKSDFDSIEVAKWQAVLRTQGLSHAEIISAERKLAAAQAALLRDSSAESVAEVKAGLAARQAAGNQSPTASLNAEIAADRQLLASGKLTYDARLALEQELATTSGRLRAETAAETLRSLQEVAQATRAGTQERIAAETEVYAFAVKTYGEYSSQAKAAFGAGTAAVTQYTAEVKAEQRSLLDGQLAVDKVMLAGERERLDAEVTAGDMTVKQKIANLRTLSEAIYQEEVDQLNAELASLDQREQAWRDTYKRLALLVAEHQREQEGMDRQVVAADKQAAQQTKQAWDEAISPIGRAFNGMISGVLQGTQTLGQAAARSAGNMAISFVEAIATMMAKAAAFFAFQAAGWTQMAKAVNPFAGEGLGGVIGKGLGIGQKDEKPSGGTGSGGTDPVAQETADQAKRTVVAQAGATQRNLIEGTSQTTQTGAVATGSATRTADETTTQTTRSGDVTVGASERQISEVGSQTAQTTAVVTGDATRTADAAGAQAAQAATQKTGVLSHAASTAAAVYDDVAQIPYVGWLLAPPAAAAAFAAVAAFGGSISSAEGGWETVPRDGMPAELHRNEMVLPASVAGPVRGMAAVIASMGSQGLAALGNAAKSHASFGLPAGLGNLGAAPAMPQGGGAGASGSGGGSGGSGTIQIQAIDAASFVNYLQRSGNSRGMVRGINRQLSAGASLSPGR